MQKKKSIIDIVGKYAIIRTIKRFIREWETMEDKLKYIYDDVYRWLVFAETKNGVFVTILLVLIERITSSSNAKQWYPFKYCVLTFIVISTIILFSSFIPYLNNCEFIKKSIAKKFYKKFHSKNAIFYGSIYFLSKEKKYSEIIKRKYNRDVELNDFEKDLLIQIEEVSEIALIKIWFFGSAVKVLVIGACCSVIALIYCA